jgi:hypothetical protein
MITDGTGLHVGVGGDLVLNFVKNKRKITEPSGNEFNPGNWVFLRFPNSRDKETLEGKRTLILNFLEKENIEYFKDKNAYLIRIPNVKIKKVLEPEIKKVLQKDPPEVINKRFDNLKELHKRLPIYGVPNTDQPDLYTYGIVNFNYFDQEQTDEAYIIFYNAGFGVEERKGKKFNLTFVLLNEGIDESKLVFGKGRLNGKTIKIFSWIIQKIHRKTLMNFSEIENLGISTRAKINMGAPEIFKLQRSLEDDFSRIIHVKSTSINESEFYLLISDKAKDLYLKSERNISICDLTTILKDPKKEVKIFEKYKLIKKEDMEKNEKILPKMLINLLKENGFKNAENKEHKPYAQISHLPANKIKVCMINAKNEEERVKLISSLCEITQDKHPDAEIQTGERKVNFVISIPGYKNPPKKILGPRKSKIEVGVVKSQEKEVKIAQMPEKRKEEVKVLPMSEKPKEEVKISPAPEPSSEPETLSESVILNREALEDSLRELISKGRMNGKPLKLALDYLSSQEDNRKALLILKKLRDLED